MNEILLVNPRRRRKGRKTRSRKRGRVRLKRSSARRRVRVRARRYKRNPSGGGFSLRSIGGQVLPTVKSGALGAVGALANDALLGFGGKYLPDMLRTGYARHATKIASAVVVGAVGNMVARGKGRDLAVGAATVAIHGLLREVVSTNFPGIALGDYEDVGAYNPGQLVDESVGAYMPGMVGDVGEYVPGFVGGDDM